ncbi:MAG: bifunctional 4-hydroxy-2-oxoglutarate aldolase/2-dehydro-3-deoxy-phosphogluconate aldolase, partial [Dysosmobacter sp.]|nr:bifunctional 4-hydroxy-2-oxoglutarate aldolase/2-dehydro-3-deoxy-phosphogluconate aldolase [Dysosmobacter sp.]
MDQILKTVSDIGIIPVIAIEDAGKAVPLARALTAGGLPAAEVTFRTAAGEEAIRRIAQNCPEVLVGAGTVLNLDQCGRALAAGAKFIVSPGYNEELVNYCVEKGVPVFPGCVNASDMTRAVNAGLKVVKFFPAEQSGGVAFLKALAPVLPLNFMPTGGVNTKNLLDYLSFERIAACGGPGFCVFYTWPGPRAKGEGGVGGGG